MDIMTYIVYFIVGVVQDFLFTMNLKAIANNKVIPAVTYSFAAILTSMLVLYNILNELDGERSVLAIIVYSCGIAFGTYIAMKITKVKK